MKEINSEITPELVLNKLHVDSDNEDFLNTFLKIDLRHGLADDLLLYGDKMGMAASVEVRVPFLDRRIVEFAFTLPNKFKIYNSSGKYLLRKMVEGVVTEPYLRYVIYLPFATAESTGLSKGKGSPGAPWLMGAGTAGAHIMINPPK